MATILDLTLQTTTTTYAGQLIHLRRIAAGRTILSLADAVERSQPFISQVEAGSRMASRETLQRIAAELGIDRHVMYTAYMRDLETIEALAWMGPQP